MSKIDRSRMVAAVQSVHSDIEKRVAARNSQLDEAGLWYELSCCILSSQVRYDLAVSAADSIAESGVLLNGELPDDELYQKLILLLNEPLRVGDQLKRYRFPNKRADQLSKIAVRINLEASTLAGLLASFNDPNDARNWLVAHAPGIGPKQASMFLRNIHHSFDFAIIDRHVVDYMKIMDIYDTKNGSLSTLRSYRKHEAVMSAHASGMGVKLGLLDWAIWVVMRVLKSMEKERIAA
ncbi:MAG: 8-oxoguanine DNA glycosylase [Sulfitobacter sp.]